MELYSNARVVKLLRTHGYCFVSDDCHVFAVETDAAMHGKPYTRLPEATDLMKIVLDLRRQIAELQQDRDTAERNFQELQDKGYYQ